jgi:nicotinamidase-related amidase
VAAAPLIGISWTRASETDAAQGRALLVLDLQKDFLAADGRFPVAEDQVGPLLTATNQLLAAAAGKGWLSVVIFNSYSPWDPHNLFRNFSAIRHSSGAAIDARVNVTGLTQFAKSEPDAFSNPDLSVYLRQHGVKQVIIAGVYAEACVAQTAQGALVRGFQPTVVSDAIAGSTTSRRVAALANLRKHGIDTESSSDLLFSR